MICRCRCWVDVLPDVRSPNQGKLTLTSRMTEPFIRIQPDSSWVPLDFGELWDYRELVYFLTWRDIQGRYRQMALGWLWIALMPLINMVVFSIVFGKFAQIPSEGIPYPVFTYTALLPWQFFADATSKSASSLINNANLIAKVYFPRLIVPLVATLAGLVDFAVSMGVLLGLLLIFGIMPNWAILSLPFYLLMAIATALGVGLWLSALAVRFHDVKYGIGFLLQVWLYASPVVYPSSLVPESWQLIYRLNPMTNVIEGFRWALLGTGQQPDFMLLVSLLVVLILIISGAYYFRQTEGTIVDVI